jgi:hypothetical protein
VRQGEDVDDDLAILINFDPAKYESSRAGRPREGDREVIFNCDRTEGGAHEKAVKEPDTCSSEPDSWNGQMETMETKATGLAGMAIRPRGPRSNKPPLIEEPKKATAQTGRHR